MSDIMRATFSQQLSLLLGEACALMRTFMYVTRDPGLEEEANAWLEKVNAVYKTAYGNARKDFERAKASSPSED